MKCAVLVGCHRPIRSPRPPRPPARRSDRPPRGRGLPLLPSDRRPSGRARAGDADAGPHHHGSGPRAGGHRGPGPRGWCVTWKRLDHRYHAASSSTWGSTRVSSGGCPAQPDASRPGPHPRLERHAAGEVAAGPGRHRPPARSPTGSVGADPVREVPGPGRRPRTRGAPGRPCAATDSRRQPDKLGQEYEPPARGRAGAGGGPCGSRMTSPS